MQLSVLYIIYYSQKAIGSRRRVAIVCFYMVVLVFSNSPFMAGSLPQSAEVQHLSAIADPFGLSSYFLEAKDLNIQQKNTQVTPFSGILLLNRSLYFTISLALLILTHSLFSFSGAATKN